MIVLVHDFHKVIKIEGIHENEYNIVSQESSIAKTIYLLSSYYPNEIIVWCHESAYSILNRSFIEQAFPHNRYFYSYNPMGNFFLDALGYVEESPFININKQVCYPTWQMSSLVGAIQSSAVLLTSKSYWEINNDFDYVLNTIAKLYQPLGFFCYSEPQLLTHSKFKIEYPKATLKQLFSFVAQQYKWVWKYFLLFCFFIFEKRFCFLSWLLSLFQSQLRNQKETIVFQHPKKTINWELETIDVIIPTIGRKKYLYDVLMDLSGQTHFPKNVIIVEQNPNTDSNSELDYLTTEEWPFQVKHVFTHQTGACQARNKALDLVESKWCFFADDDIRIMSDFLGKIIEVSIRDNLKVCVANCLQENEVKKYFKLCQTTVFGSGCSIVRSECLNDLKFETKLEFGFGEDTDFGLELRRRGTDVFYIPEPEILHLKAPVGGFRTKFRHQWEDDLIQPKPSPTIMFVKQKFLTKEQLLGYKLRLFLKINKLRFWKLHFFKKQWVKSEYWANKL